MDHPFLFEFQPIINVYFYFKDAIFTQNVSFTSERELFFIIVSNVLMKKQQHVDNVIVETHVER